MFKGLGQLGDMAKVMKQAQEMQTRMAEMQAKMDEVMVEGQAGAGLVKVSANAKGVLSALHIDDSLFVAENKEVVEDLVLAAIRDAQDRAVEAQQNAVNEMTEGLDLPEGFKMPF